MSRQSVVRLQLTLLVFTLSKQLVLQQPVLDRVSLFVEGNIEATGNITVGVTITYDDVTNIDSIGLITARDGLQVLSGIVTIGSNISIQ